MWLPMWVFDGNGFTMACLAVWIRNVALRWGSSATVRRSGVADATASNGSSQHVRISVATSGTDFTAPEADFAALTEVSDPIRSPRRRPRIRCRHREAKAATCSFRAPRHLQRTIVLLLVGSIAELRHAQRDCEAGIDRGRRFGRSRRDGPARRKKGSHRLLQGSGHACARSRTNSPTRLHGDLRVTQSQAGRPPSGVFFCRVLAISTRMNDAAVISVLIAAMVGSISSRSAVNIRLVSGWYWPPEMNRPTTVSSIAEMKAKMLPVSTLALICGSVTAKKLRKRLMPRLRATISCAGSKLCKPATTEVMT